MNTPKITIFTTPSCQQCRLTEAHMTKRGLAFQTVHLDKEPTIAAQLREQGFVQAPVVQIAEDSLQMWSGFRPDLIGSLRNA